MYFYAPSWLPICALAAVCLLIVTSCMSKTTDPPPPKPPPPHSPPTAGGGEAPVVRDVGRRHHHGPVYRPQHPRDPPLDHAQQVCECARVRARVGQPNVTPWLIMFLTTAWPVSSLHPVPPPLPPCSPCFLPAHHTSSPVYVLLIDLCVPILTQSTIHSPAALCLSVPCPCMRPWSAPTARWRASPGSCSSRYARACVVRACCSHFATIPS